MAFKAFTKFCSNNITVIAGVGVACGVAASMTPEMFFLSKWKNMTQYLEKDGREKKFDPATQALIDKILFQVNMKPEEEANLDFYVCSLTDPTHYGSTKLRTGAYVGLPVSFQYGKDTVLPKDTLFFSGIRLAFDDSSNSQAAKDLADAVILSQKGKEFLIAREIHYARSFRFHIDSMLRTGAASGFILSLNFLYNRLPVMRAVKTWAKVLSFCGISMIWMGLYLLLRDTHRCWVDYAVDKKTARMGKSYAEGGVEYYQSVLKRNQALRVLTRDGKRWFTPFGNEISTFRQKTLQKTSRRDNIARILKKYEEEEAKDAAPVIEAENEMA